VALQGALLCLMMMHSPSSVGPLVEYNFMRVDKSAGFVDSHKPVVLGPGTCGEGGHRQLTGMVLVIGGVVAILLLLLFLLLMMLVLELLLSKLSRRLLAKVRAVLTMLVVVSGLLLLVELSELL